MTIKIQAYQTRGIKTNKIVDEFEFCCWQSLADWLNSGFILHKCPECKSKQLKQPKFDCGQNGFNALKQSEGSERWKKK